jgi:hypothetical protein
MPSNDSEESAVSKEVAEKALQAPLELDILVPPEEQLTPPTPSNSSNSEAEQLAPITP